MRTHFFMIVLTLLLFSCSETTMEPVEEEAEEQFTISITNSSRFEGTSNPNFAFEVTLDKALSSDLELTYTLEGITAVPDVDFDGTPGSITIPAGVVKSEISIPIINDDINEVDEKMKILVKVPSKPSQSAKEGIGEIKDDDEPVFADETGYSTGREFFGYNLVWEEEFDGDQLDLNSFGFEYGDNGWGNNELQNYVDDAKNIFVQDSKLTIKAIEDTPGKFTSARLITKDKKEFRLGRIDIRAKLPKGQGIWPAIWMLGANFDDVGWPACGEIDIMELVGHEPKTSHGTAHWGLPGEGSTFLTKAYTINEDFQEKFHVFSIVWELNEIVWYVDETRFHSVDASQMRGKPYPFNQNFFFIFNVAVGGNWPGPPDATTVFPQEMVVDYVRVFQ